MSESIDLREIERRPTRYWNVDGLPELMMGLLWILWGGSWFFGQSLPRGAAWNVYWMFTPALLVLSGLASIWATKRLKTRITFPRTGYVDWKEPTHGQRLIAAAVAMVTAALLTALLMRARARGIEHVVSPAMGVLLSLAFVVASLTQRAPHLLALAGVALVLGLAFGGLNAGWQATNWMLIGMGTAMCLSGAVRLRLFLKRSPLETHA
jgi:ABC-type multidrug transport system fused ATPase/permease subunit